MADPPSIEQTLNNYYYGGGIFVWCFFIWWMNNYVYSTLVDWLSNLAEVILNAFEEDRSLIIHLNEHQIGNRESAYTLKFIFVPFLVIKYPQMTSQIGQSRSSNASLPFECQPKRQYFECVLTHCVSTMNFKQNLLWYFIWSGEGFCLKFSPEKRYGKTHVCLAFSVEIQTEHFCTEDRP